jgi:hypothetical protein
MRSRMAEVVSVAETAPINSEHLTEDFSVSSLSTKG